MLFPLYKSVKNQRRLSDCPEYQALTASYVYTEPGGDGIDITGRLLMQKEGPVFWIQVKQNKFVAFLVPTPARDPNTLLEPSN